MSKPFTTILNNNTIVKRLLISLVIITGLLLTYMKLYEPILWESQRLSATSLMLREQDPSICQIQMLEDEMMMKQPSIFSPYVFSSSPAEEQDPFQYSPITAIVSRIDANEGSIKSVVQHLLKYPFIKEIIINNQVKSIPLSEETIQELRDSAIVSKENRVDIHLFNEDDDETGGSQPSVLIHKYAACTRATYEKCYFQDDLWLNVYLDTLYTHSHRFASHYVVNTRPSNYLDYMTWRYKNRDVSMHTGYSDLRYGAFIMKDKARRFMVQWATFNMTTVLNRISAHKTSDLRERLSYMAADIYFTIWQNQYPYLVTNPLLSSKIDSFKHVDTVNNRDLVKQIMFDALSILESSLRNSTFSEGTEGDDGVLFVRDGVPPATTERDVRTSCANDKCLFITSISHTPNIEYDDHLEFNVNRSTVDEPQSSLYFSNISQYEDVYLQQHNNAYQGNMSAWVTSSLKDHIHYHKAVDQDISTCWTSLQNPKADDYFGLYMAGDIKARRVLFYTPTNAIISNTNNTDELRNQFSVTVQFMLFGSWEECNITSTNTAPPSLAATLPSLVALDFECPSRKNYYEPFKSIRISFKKDLQEPFELCSIGLDNFLV